MSRKRLIFFVTADPAVDSSAVVAAYQLAAAATEAGLDAEVRLAGDAVLVADPGYVATVAGSITLRDRVDRAAATRITVSACPESVDAHGILDEQLQAIGARPRPTSEILEEVADGRSALVGI